MRALSKEDKAVLLLLMRRKRNKAEFYANMQRRNNHAKLLAVAAGPLLYRVESMVRAELETIGQRGTDAQFEQVQAIAKGIAMAFAATVIEAARSNIDAAKNWTRAQAVEEELVRIAGAAMIHAALMSSVWIMWVTQDDGKVCKICEERDGEVYPPGAVPPFPAHPLCRCYLSATGS